MLVVLVAVGFTLLLLIVFVTVILSQYAKSTEMDD